MAQGTCSVDGCLSPRWRRLYCVMHYGRWLKHGDPLVTLNPAPSPTGPLTTERLREVLDYDPATGVFRWKVNRRYLKLVGVVAGSTDLDGYWRIVVDCTTYRAARLAWLHVYGVWPDGQIDHRNGDRRDNRIANLREATQSENMTNIINPCKNGASGYRGVNYHRASRKWRATIKVDHKVYELGRFDTAEEARATYVAAKRDLHPFCAQL